MSKAKDPAVLWYYRDYLSGTEEMTWAQQGAYARLLNKQADKGHLSLDMIKKILKKDFGGLWPHISHKFLLDPEGNFYNDRMDMEVAKRAKNSQTQRDRINAYWEEQRKNDGNTTEYTTEYTTEIPIANANARKENNSVVVARHVGLIPDMVASFRKSFPDYPADPENDYPACLGIARKIASAKNWTESELMNVRRMQALAEWEAVIAFIVTDDWYSKQSITMLAKKWQDLIQTKNRQKSTPAGGKGAGDTASEILKARNKHNV